MQRERKHSVQCSAPSYVCRRDTIVDKILHNNEPTDTVCMAYPGIITEGKAAPRNAESEISATPLTLN